MSYSSDGLPLCLLTTKISLYTFRFHNDTSVAKDESNGYSLVSFDAKILERGNELFALLSPQDRSLLFG
jgi:hypothetical protein